MSRASYIIPRLYNGPSAAAYMGISPTKLRDLGLPRRIFGGNLMYEKDTLDNHIDNLPFEGEQEGGNTCDEAFG